MIESCGLNRLSFYGTSVSLHIRAAQNDPNVLKVLQNLRSINYTGVAVPKGDEEWAHDNNIPCVVRHFRAAPLTQTEFTFRVYMVPQRHVSYHCDTPLSYLTIPSHKLP